MCDPSLLKVHTLEEVKKYRLRNNGIFFPEINFDEIRAACIGLSRMLLHKGIKILDYDYFLFWAWSAELMMKIEKGYFADEDFAVKELFMSTSRVALTPGILGAYSDINSTSDNVRHLSIHSYSILAYLVFPLLEAIIKKNCNLYINPDGKILKKFKVPRKNGKVAEYSPYEGEKNQCNSLRDLLWLLYEYVSDSELKTDLKEIRNLFSNIGNGSDGFDVIGEWRNSALHGETAFNVIGGAVLNLIILIMLHSIKDRYEEFRQSALSNINFYHNKTFRPKWSFYPPY